MSEFWLGCDALFANGRIHQAYAMQIINGRVDKIKPRSQVTTVINHLSGIVCPAYVDLQVNGGGGVLLNTSPSSNGIVKIVSAHFNHGTGPMLPTVITDAWEVLKAVAEAAISAREQAGMMGLHIEGPHIASKRKGTHDARYIRPLDEQTLHVVRRLVDAKLAVMITLAPEAATNTQIAELTEMGAVVSLGHSDASAEQTEAALKAGAKSFTHLYNAMSPMSHRAPGMVGAALNSAAYCGIIVDGHHVDDSMVAMACRARPVEDRMYLVSDAMPTLGGPDRFELYGQSITVKEGRLINAEGVLAGAHLCMAWAVKRAGSQVGLPLEQVLRMAITNPASLIGHPEWAAVEGRALSGLIQLDSNLNVIRRLSEPDTFISM